MTLFERLQKLPGPMRAAVLLMAAGVAGLAVVAAGGGARGDVATPGLAPVASHVTQAPQQAPRQAPAWGAGCGDVLDRLRAARTPALEREILEIARAAVVSATTGKGAAEPGRDRTDRPESVPTSDTLPRDSRSGSILGVPAGVFVALILDGRVRGCIGTVYPMEASLAEEIASAARMAATSDPRRPPVRPAEVARLDYCVSVVGRLRRHEPEAPVNPRTEGVIVKANGRSGVILPGEARTGAYEIAWAKREAGVGPGDHFELFVFETERFGKALPLRR